MKKKLLVVFLSVIAAVCLCLGLSACGEEHTHTAASAVRENEVAATCTTNGSYESVIYCSECGEEISRETVTVNATGHSWNSGEVTTEATCTEQGVMTYTCTVCGETKTEAIATIAHTTVHVDATEATETADGNYEYWHCSVCGKYFLDEACTTETTADEVVIEANHTHEAVKVEAAEPTCAEEGNIEYWYCSDCGKYFLDEDCTQLTTKDAVSIATISHTITHYNAKAATCTEDGNIEFWKCTVCGKYFLDEDGENETTLSAVIVKATGVHKLVKVDAKDATETTDGNIEYWYCSDCGVLFADENGETETTSEAVTIPMHTHTLVKVDAKAASCSAEGNTEYWYCSVCGKLFADENGTTETTEDAVAIAKTSHTRTMVNATEATCTEDGNVQYWYCLNCGALFSDRNETPTTLEEITIKATGHTAEHTAAVDATCTTEGNIEYWYCSVCKKYFSDSECTTEISSSGIVVAASHTMTHYEPTEATDTTDGNREYWYCSVCGKYFLDEEGANETTADEVVIAAGHYTHTLEHVEAKAATCSETGNTEYWHCTVCGLYYADENSTVLTNLANVTIAKTEHTYSDYSSNENGHWYECTVCGNTTEVESHTYNSKNVCTVCGYELADSLYYTLSSDQNSYTVSGIGTYTSTDIVIPETYNGLPVTAIADNAFVNNSTITSVTIPSSIVKVGYGAFFRGYSIETITFLDDGNGNYSLTTIDDLSFCYCTSVKSINIPDSVTTIGYQAFYGCSALESVTLGSGVKTIDQMAFFQCTALTSINIPASVETIGYQTFCGCTALVEVTGCAGLTTIGTGAFYQCTSLVRFNSTVDGECVISSSVTSIGTYAFRYCTSLTSITFEDATGWYLTSTENGSSEVTLDLTDSSQNVDYLTYTYRTYYWYKA